MAPDSSSYRVTLFFGPEPVDGKRALVCVFNVKKRSWKAGMQVSVEVSADQLENLQHKIQLSDRLAQSLQAVPAHERSIQESRAADFFTQAVSRCKLDLCLQAGLQQENQRIAEGDLVTELDQAITERSEYVMAYVLTELDLTSDRPSPSSH